MYAALIERRKHCTPLTTQTLPSSPLVDGQLYGRTTSGSHELVGVVAQEGDEHRPYLVHVERSTTYIAFWHPYFECLTIYRGPACADVETARSVLSPFPSHSALHTRDVRRFIATVRNGPLYQFHALRDPDKCAYTIEENGGRCSLSLDDAYVRHLWSSLSRIDDVTLFLNPPLLDAFRSRDLKLPFAALMAAYAQSGNALRTSIVRMLSVYHEEPALLFLAGLLQQSAARGLWRDALDSLRGKTNPAVVERLVAFAASSTGEHKIAALRCLAGRDGVRVRSVVLSALADPDPSVRSLAARLAINLVDREIVRSVYALLQSDNSTRVQRAARTFFRQIVRTTPAPATPP